MCGDIFKPFWIKALTLLFLTLFFRDGEYHDVVHDEFVSFLFSNLSLM